MDAALRTLLARLVDGRLHTGAALALHRARDGAGFAGGAGDLSPDTPVYAASATKLLVAVLVRQLEAEGRLARADPFRRHLPGPETGGLSVIGGRDRTGEITLAQLLAHTSGLPDYFEGAAPGFPRRRREGLLARLLAGRDEGWTFAEAMAIARRMGARHPPGQTRRAHYADTNFQILGRVIEAAEGAPLAEVMRRRLFAPLGLRQTWLACDPADDRPAPLRHGLCALRLPRAMASFQGDGGLVTTAREGLALLRAAFDGRHLPAGTLTEGQVWRPVFFPLDYGEGVMRFAPPRWMTGLRRLPAFFGHSGLSGAFLFHCPALGLSLAGTTNQIARPSAPFRLMLRAALAAA